MSQTLRLVINTERLLPDAPLPVQYMGVQRVDFMHTVYAETPCSRCQAAWGEHDWVLFVDWANLLDCSLRPRGVA